MELFTEDNATRVVQQRNSACRDPRARRILDVVTAHLHAIVRELEPTRAAWEQAIAFLTDAVFGVKESLVVTPSRVDDAERARAAGVAAPLWEIAFDFALAR
jgi:hypothetical protein